MMISNGVRTNLIGAVSVVCLARGHDIVSRSNRSSLPTRVSSLSQHSTEYP